MNCAIFMNGSDMIDHFVRNCVQRGNDYLGDNSKLYGIKTAHWSVKWTEDDATEVKDRDGNVMGWDKTVSQLAASTDRDEIKAVSEKEYRAAFKIRRQLSEMSYADIETYINANVTDLTSAKAYLIKLSKVALAMAKMMDADIHLV